MKKEKMYGFAKYVLTDDKLRKYMKKGDYCKFLSLKNNLHDLDFELADKVASAIKKWALSMGATHYTHWFFPLTGKYAEKQVSFLDYGSKGEFINKFNGNSLIKGETDASSFPSGGERMTFEARGYTVWDYSSPVFIKTDDTDNKVLYIPTAFCSFTGIALDEKTPLLRSTEYLNREATKLLHLLGHTSVKKVIAHTGSEQEYFLIDEDLYHKRKDLVFTGRTLLGSNTIKTQKTSHHYFGQISDRVSAYMHELDKELWALGIMAKIQHNEVAPTQHEIVPVFSEVNIASDQNALLMEIMNKVAKKHGFKVLFHEKPYKGVNGSGKHNNWSISTDTGINLLDYNKIDENTFMLIFTSVISAIDKHYDLLRLSTISHSNDMRLGGHEAPPSIISVYVGDDMLEVLNNYVSTNTFTKKSKTLLDIKTSRVAKLYKDNSDRNRTSPFAYTGNKFEFRMVGSSQNISLSNTILDTIVAHEFSIINDRLTTSSDISKEITKIITDNIKNHSRIIFNGNSYDESWKIESKNRGFINYSNSIDTLDRWIAPENISLFEESKVLSPTELRVRYETYMNEYIDYSIIEAKALLNICYKQVIPSINKHISELMSINEELEDININCNSYKSEIKNLISKVTKLKSTLTKLEKAIIYLSNLSTPKEKAIYCKDNISEIMLDIRGIYDNMENTIPNDLKPFPDYDDLLY